MADMTEDQRRELEERLRSMSPEELKEYQKRQCIFCRMLTGEIPAKRLYEDDKVFAILDINPAAAGHVLVLPKDHVMLLQQLPDDDIAHVFAISRSFSQAFLQVLRSEGSTICVASGQAAGQRAQHAMIHIIPRKEGDGIGIRPKSIPCRPQDLETVAKALRPFCEKSLGTAFTGQKKAVPTLNIPKVIDQEAVESPKGATLAVDSSAKGEEKQGPALLPSLREEQTSKEGRRSQRSSLDDIADFLSKK